ncbi:MAG: hypothetical protein HQM11_00020 [SAR324 cluster bacterium]|nr:hypothetical protein [SAR324 cluster bacterium]
MQALRFCLIRCIPWVALAWPGLIWAACSYQDIADLKNESFRDDDIRQFCQLMEKQNAVAAPTSNLAGTPVNVSPAPACESVSTLPDAPPAQETRDSSGSSLCSWIPSLPETSWTPLRGINVGLTPLSLLAGAIQLQGEYMFSFGISLGVELFDWDASSKNYGTQSLRLFARSYHPWRTGHWYGGGGPGMIRVEYPAETINNTGATLDGGYRWVSNQFFMDLGIYMGFWGKQDVDGVDRNLNVIGGDWKVGLRF